MRADVNEEIEKLQGTWNVVSLEVEGSTMEPSVFRGSQIVVQGDQFTTIAMGAEYDGRLRVDATKTPAALDLLFTTGPEKGNTSLGIYELDGDTWKLCLTIGAKDRPRKFATKPGSGLALETLERETLPDGKRSGKKSARKKPLETERASPPETHTIPLGPATELEGEWAMVSCTLDGKALDESAVKYGKRVTKGSETTVFMGGQILMKVRFTIDHSKTPKAIDYVHTYGRSKGDEQQGIYELDGTKLKISFSAPGRERPTDFKTAPGDARTVTAWRRSQE
jgi:uncharacterized protein (TIGR03067 family)